MSFQKKYLNNGRSCHIPSKVPIVVQPDLAITPSRMASLVDEGIPVSSSLFSGFFNDGVDNPSWDLPIDQRRGVDVAEVWNAERSARLNITNKFELKT